MKTITALHVEDDLDAAFFLKRAVEKAKLPLNLKHLKDGEEAIAYLGGSPLSGEKNDTPQPDIILLDLKLPFKDGFEVLAWTKTRPELNDVPVIILTSSDREEDLSRAKAMGATLYLTKTVTFGNVIETLADFLRRKSE